jgi:hypothetical protein
MLDLSLCVRGIVRAAQPNPYQAGSTAVASISRRASGSTSRVTSTTAMAVLAQK